MRLCEIQKFSSVSYMRNVHVSFTSLVTNVFHLFHQKYACGLTSYLSKWFPPAFSFGQKFEFGPVRDENNSMTSKCFGTKSNSHREHVGKHVNIHGTRDYSPRTQWNSCSYLRTRIIFIHSHTVRQRNRFHSSVKSNNTKYCSDDRAL